jgi:AraC-like DNA-binding protein
MAFSSDAEAGVYAYEPLLWPDPTQDLYRFALEFTLSSHLTVIHDIHGTALRPLRVSLAYLAPPHADVYREMLHCRRVQFGQRNNEMAFDAAWIARPMPLADPITHASCREMCEQLLSDMNAGDSLACDIRSTLIAHPGRFPSIEAMADRLSMHPRVLRRRLSAEKTSYRRLLAEVRARLALEYLRRTSMTNDEIGARLGYSDAANFRRAFTSWTGKCPSEFRVA